MKRLSRVFLYAATVASTLLCLSAIAMRVASAFNCQVIARIAPADGRLWTIRDGRPLTGGDGREIQLFTVAPWPHPDLTEFYLVRGPASPGPRAWVMIGAESTRGDDRNWPGVRFHASDAIISIFLPTSQGRPVPYPQPVPSATICVKYWVPIVAFGLLPAMLLVRRLPRRRRVRPGTCVQCGYDLRATPDRCPECGTQAAAPAAR